MKISKNHTAGLAQKQGFTLVEIMIVVVIIGLLAAMAIPAFQKVRETSQTNTIKNNLRQLASAANQYFLEYGVTEVELDALVGIEKYIKSLDSVCGEEYPELITENDGVLTAVDGSVGTVTLDF